MNTIFELLVMACGMYVIYWAMQMKSTKQIPEMLVGKGFSLNRAKDPEGFMRSTFPFTIGTGILLLVAGAIGLWEVFALYSWADTCIDVMVLIELILYGMFLLRAQKKYLVGMDKNDKKE